MKAKEVEILIYEQATRSQREAVARCLDIVAQRGGFLRTSSRRRGESGCPAYADPASQSREIARRRPTSLLLHPRLDDGHHGAARAA